VNDSRPERMEAVERNKKNSKQKAHQGRVRFTLFVQFIMY